MGTERKGCGSGSKAVSPVKALRLTSLHRKQVLCTVGHGADVSLTRIIILYNNRECHVIEAQFRARTRINGACPHGYRVQVLTRPYRASESRGRDPPIERTGTHIVPFPLLLIHLIGAPFRFLPHTALVPLPPIPCPPPPLQPSLGRSDKPIRLFDSLAAPKPLSARAHVIEHVLPFELDVIIARVKYWAATRPARTPRGVDAARGAHVSTPIARCELSAARA